MDELRFTSIFIGDDNYKDYKFESNNGFIENLAQINIFVGKNNAGKSRFIRKIFTDKEIKFLAPKVSLGEINLQIDNFIKQFNNNIIGLDIKDIDTRIKDIKPFKYLSSQNSFSSFMKTFNELRLIISGKTQFEEWRRL